MLAEKDKNMLKKLYSIRIENGSTKSEELVAQTKINNILKKEKNKGDIKIQNDTNVKNHLKTNNNWKTEWSTNVETQDEIKSEVKYTNNNYYNEPSVVDTEKHFICPHCGNDVFIHGCRGGLMMNVACNNCFAEFQTIMGEGVRGEIYGLDFSSLKFDYGVSPRQLKKKNIEAYNRIKDNSSLWQRIFYKFR